MNDGRQPSLNFLHAPEHFDKAVSRGDGYLKVRVKAKPGASKMKAPRLVDVGDDHWAVEIAVREAAVDGKANAALIEAIAEWLDVPKAHIMLTSGATSKLKIFKIASENNSLYSRLAASL